MMKLFLLAMCLQIIMVGHLPSETEMSRVTLIINYTRFLTPDFAFKIELKLPSQDWVWIAYYITHMSYMCNLWKCMYILKVNSFFLFSIIDQSLRFCYIYKNTLTCYNKWFFWLHAVCWYFCYHRFTRVLLYSTMRLYF